MGGIRSIPIWGPLPSGLAAEELLRSSSQRHREQLSLTTLPHVHLCPAVLADRQLQAGILRGPGDNEARHSISGLPQHQTDRTHSAQAACYTLLPPPQTQAIRYTPPAVHTTAPTHCLMCVRTSTCACTRTHTRSRTHAPCFIYNP